MDHEALGRQAGRLIQNLLVRPVYLVVLAGLCLLNLGEMIGKFDSKQLSEDASKNNPACVHC